MLESNAPAKLHPLTFSKGLNVLMIVQGDMVHLYTETFQLLRTITLPSGFGRGMTVSVNDEVVYLAHPEYPLHQLARDGEEWELTEVELKDGPYGSVEDEFEWKVDVEQEDSRYSRAYYNVTLTSTSPDFSDVAEGYEHQGGWENALFLEARVDGLLRLCYVVRKISDYSVRVGFRGDVVEVEKDRGGRLYYYEAGGSKGVYSYSKVFSNKDEWRFVRVNEGQYGAAGAPMASDGWYRLWGYYGEGTFTREPNFDKGPGGGSDLVTVDFFWVSQTQSQNVLYSDPRFLKRYSSGSETPGDAGTYAGVLTVSDRYSRVHLTASKAHDFGDKDVGRLIRFSFGGTPYYGRIDSISLDDEGIPRRISVVGDIPYPDGPFMEGSFANEGRAESFQRGSFYEGNYPSIVHFYNQRMVLAATKERPQTLWFSEVGNVNKFSPTDSEGNVVDSCGFSRTLDTTLSNPIHWVRTHHGLVIGTRDGEWHAMGQGESTNLTPTSFVANLETSLGSRDTGPTQTGGSLLFVSDDGRSFYDYHYDYRIRGYVGIDLAALARHLSGPSGFRKAVHHREGSGLYWLINERGDLFSLTYDAEQEAVAWARHSLGGTYGGLSARVRDVSVLNGSLYLLVERTPQDKGQSGLTLERMGSFFVAEDPTDRRACHFVDCGIAYSGPNKRGLLPVEHLSREYVGAMVDGRVYWTGFEEKEPEHPTRYFAEIEEDRRILAHIGYPYVSKAVTLPLVLEGTDGMGLIHALEKRVSHVGLNMENSYGVSVYAETDDPAYFELFDEPHWNVPPALFTGDSRHEIEFDYEKGSSIIFEERNPVPCSILAFSLEVT